MQVRISHFGAGFLRPKAENDESSEQYEVICKTKYHARKAREKRGKQEHPMVECRNCGRSFPKERTRRYCSAACRTEWYKKQRQQEEKTGEARRCKLCGKPLKKPGWVYCDQACRKQAMEQTLETRAAHGGGTYPWPPGEPGSVVEIDEREFEYLLSRSNVAIQGEKIAGGTTEKMLQFLRRSCIITL